MKLYYSPGACSLATHVALREIGADFVLEAVRDGRTESGRDFRAVNPRGYVAALELDDGEVLTESAALLQYVAALDPGAGLAPTDPLPRARLQEALNFLSSELHKAFSPLFDPSAPEPVRVVARTRVAGLMDHVERRLADGRSWFLGPDYTVADAHLFAIAGWAEPVGVGLAAWPNLRGWMERMRARPAVQAALKAEGLA